MPTAKTKRRIWHGCYSGNWKGIIVEDAFQHPAKMARGVVARIFDHLFARGYIQRGSLIVDPFGGIGTTAIEGASRGCRIVCVELEPKFVELAKRNFELHRVTWEGCGDPLPVMVQGDSRRLVEVLAQAQAVISSPPYSGNEKADYLMSDDGKTRARDERRGFKQGKGCFRGSEGAYGQTTGQLGTLPSGNVDAAIGSPPFLDARQDTTNSVPTKKGVDAVLGSPPHADSSVTGDRNFVGGGGRETAAAEVKQGYGDQAGNLGNLPTGSVDATVSSPPWESGAEGALRAGKWRNPEDALKAGRGHGCTDEARLRQMERDQQKTYGESAGQLGIEQGGTFWSAAKQIVEQCFAILKPGGIAVWVCKDFVRNKKRVPFSDDWRRLCESVGFVTIEWIKASLVKEWEEATLFNGTETKRRERKSFFRRIAEKKGSPRIDWEDVLVMRKP